MERYDPFEKLSDLYDSIVDWKDDPLIQPENQNKYFFSDGKTYYEELCKILKLLSVFKNGFDQIYDNLDELEEQITESGVTREDLDEAIDNLHTLITSEIATVEDSLSSDITDVETSVSQLTSRVTASEGNISSLQTLTSTHSSDIQTINTAIFSIQQSLATKIGDAPMDGKTYGRKNGTWNEVTGGGGGTSDYDALDNKPQINGNILTGNKTSSQLGLADASSLASYVSKAEAPGYDDILTETNAESIYQTILAMNNYLLKNDAPGYADILTKTDASSLYQTILGMSNYLLKSDAPGYGDILTETEASALYQTITAMSNYLLKTDAPGYADILTKTSAESLYQKIVSMGNYLLKSEAPGYADILTETEASALYQTIAGMSNYMPADRIASASQLGGIKVGNNLSIDANGVLSASSGTPEITLSGTISVESSTSPGTAPTYRNIDLNYRASSDYSNLIIYGTAEFRGSGTGTVCTITTNFIIPNWTKGETRIGGVPFNSSANPTNLVIRSSGRLDIELTGSTNFATYFFPPYRMVMADY